MSDEATRSERIALIKEHALNSLQLTPLSVTTRDRLFLISEIERLQQMLDRSGDKTDHHNSHTAEEEPMITIRLSEWLRMDEEIKRLRADLAEVAVAIRQDAAHRATLADMLRAAKRQKIDR